MDPRSERGGPYRTKAILPPPLTPTFWDKHPKLLDALKVVTIVQVLLLVFGLIVAGTATALQFVVNGLAGSQVGEYPHYLVGVFLWGLYTIKRNQE